MAQWGFEGAYLHGEMGSRPVLQRQSQSPSLGNAKGAGACSLPCPLPHGHSGEGGMMAWDLVPLPSTFQPHEVLNLQL